MWKLLVMVGVGGGIGSVLRFLVGSGVQRWVGESWMPVGTFVVNVVGCLILGFLGGLVEHRQLLTQHWRMLLMTGMMGGFTTFSTFGYETLMLARNGPVWGAVANVLLSVVVGLLAAWLGFGIAGRV